MRVCVHVLASSSNASRALPCMHAGSDDQQQQQQKKGRKTGGFSRSTPFNPAQAAQRPVGRSATCPAPAHSVGSEHMEEGETDEDLDLDLDLEEEEAELEEEMKEKEGKEGRDFSRLSVVSLLQKKNKAKRSKAKELQARRWAPNYCLALGSLQLWL
eukprot:1147905-Pelagomonas_calceolata.AAC.5